jgi:lipoprotein-anchoring transpeptidase ErfK/SrfK
MKLLPTALSLAIAVSCLSSCSVIEARKARRADEAKVKEAAAKPEVLLFDWKGSDVSPLTGTLSVRINLSEQKARIYQNGQEIAWTYVATGTSNRPTPTGSFHIMEKKADKASNRWGIMVNAAGETVNWNACNGVSRTPSGGHFVGAPMPHWMRLTSTGVGMHGGPIPNPGSPASHGCIRLPYEMAGKMFAALPSGTSVTITH